MEPVEVIPIENKNLVLRARGSELLIAEDHVKELKSKTSARDLPLIF